MLEPRFNVEALALLLNIPPSKTLLRRHLATHFHLLVGAEAQREKQECLENPDYSILTATARVKVRTLRPLQAADIALFKARFVFKVLSDGLPYVLCLLFSFLYI